MINILYILYIHKYFVNKDRKKKETQKLTKPNQTKITTKIPSYINTWPTLSGY